MNEVFKKLIQGHLYPFLSERSDSFFFSMGSCEPRNIPHPRLWRGKNTSLRWSLSIFSNVFLRGRKRIFRESWIIKLSENLRDKLFSCSDKNVCFLTRFFSWKGVEKNFSPRLTRKVLIKPFFLSSRNLYLSKKPKTKACFTFTNLLDGWITWYKFSIKIWSKYEHDILKRLIESCWDFSIRRLEECTTHEYFTRRWFIEKFHSPTRRERGNTALVDSLNRRESCRAHQAVKLPWSVQRVEICEKNNSGFQQNALEKKCHGKNTWNTRCWTTRSRGKMDTRRFLSKVKAISRINNRIGLIVGWIEAR